MHCENKNKEGLVSYPCLYDQFVHPAPLAIGAGLSSLPRQMATFPEFRRAMLHMIKSTEVETVDQNNQVIKITPLSAWRARDKDDLGIMLLEMWAYVCDALSFYDEVIANETYLRTGRLRSDLRALVALLGYLPRPAVGSRVALAAMADGRVELKVPAGTAFRSGAFDGNPPQVFELDNDAFIHPFTNQWKISSPHAGELISGHPDALLVSVRSVIKEEAILLLTDANNPGQNQGLTVKKLEKYTGKDQQQYTRITFTAATNLQAATLLEGLRLMKPTQAVSLWTGEIVFPPSVGPAPGTSSTSAYSTFASAKKKYIGFDLPDVSGNARMLTLNSLIPQIKPGHYILVTYDQDIRWFRVIKNSEVNGQPLPAGDMTINGMKFTLSGITTKLTQLTLDERIDASARTPAGAQDLHSSIGGDITVHYGLETVATVADEPKVLLTSGDPLYLSGFTEAPVGKISPAEFLLQDKNTAGMQVSGNIDFDERKLTVNQGVTWNTALALPVEAYGNVLTASQGEKVVNEIMGSGDASLSNQTFRLKKKPLSYHLSPTAENDQGVGNSLKIYVNGIRWTEVNSFFAKKENDQVYIVRQNDEQDSLVTFGDGIRGERLPSGVNNVMASYRFGAGAACPPAGSVNQIAKPVKGLQSVKNILPAFGGADAEPAGSLRIYAPKSALILGRVVSLKDMEALAGQFPGVRAVQTAWRWNKTKQCASAHIFYIGEDGLAASLSQRLRNVSDPSVSISVEKSQPVPLTISLNIQIDAWYLEADILQQLRQALMNKQTGMLAPENIGIGQPLYRSNIFQAVLDVNGITAVESILLDGAGFQQFAVTPGTGNYFDVEQGKLFLNGKEN